MLTSLERRAQRSLPIFAALALLFAPQSLSAAASASSKPDSSDDTIRVLVSIPPQEWLVERIGGIGVHATALLSPGDSPETYQPTDAEVSAALRSQLFVPMGVPFERGAWAQALARTPGLIFLDPPVPEVPANRDAHLHHEHDPHLWLSPRRLERSANQISQALSRLAPLRAADFEKSLATVLSELRNVDRDLRSLLEPWHGARFLVLHPSWTTFALDYGLKQLAIESQGHDPSDAELTELLRLARESGVTTLFVQPAATGRTASAFASTLGLSTRTLAPLARDLPDNLMRTAEQLVASFEDARDRRNPTAPATAEGANSGGREAGDRVESRNPR